jgi:alanine racemase
VKHPHQSSWVEIDLKAIRFNYEQLKRLAIKQFDPAPLRIPTLRRKGSYPQILPVIKADAYGHGMKEVGTLLNKLGVGLLCVSDLSEGIDLRRQGVMKPILLLESTLPSLAKDIIDYRLTPTVVTWPLALALNRYAKLRKRIVCVHVKVDTGMGRLGVPYPQAQDFINRLMKLSHLQVEGLYTHFPVADTDYPFTMGQIEKLYQMVKFFDRQGKIILYIHATNSMGVVGYKHHIFNLARPGLMLYGLYPTDKLRKKVQLKPAMTVKTTVIFVKNVSSGTGISYGHTFVTKKSMTVATLPIGYQDGYLRSLSNKAAVLIDGKRCTILGRVTMDQIIVDVSKVKNPRIGMEAVILGKQGNEEISANDLARQAGTINYEIICSLGNRLPRIYKR